MLFTIHQPLTLCLWYLPWAIHIERKRQLNVLFGFFLATGDPGHNLSSHASPQTKGGKFSVYARSHLPDSQLSHGCSCCQPFTEASAL